MIFPLFVGGIGPRHSSALLMFAKSTKARKVPASPFRAQ
jgi:hypothetical protein